MVKRIVKWWADLNCTHKETMIEFGYGHMPPYGIGGYSYKECTQCNKYLGLESFERDKEMYINPKKELQELYEMHGNGD